MTSSRRLGPQGEAKSRQSCHYRHRELTEATTMSSSSIRVGRSQHADLRRVAKVEKLRGTLAKKGVSGPPKKAAPK